MAHVQNKSNLQYFLYDWQHSLIVDFSLGCVLTEDIIESKSLAVLLASNHLMDSDLVIFRVAANNRGMAMLSLILIQWPLKVGTEGRSEGVTLKEGEGRIKRKEVILGKRLTCIALQPSHYSQQQLH